MKRFIDRTDRCNENYWSTTYDNMQPDVALNEARKLLVEGEVTLSFL